MSRTRARALTAALLSLALLVLIVAPALSAGYGRGTFTGKAKSQFDKDRPKTPIEIKVKGKRARIVKAVFVFDGCGDSESTVRRTIETPFKRVTTGPAGGGFYYDAKIKGKEGPEKLDVTIFLGLRERHIRGTADAYMEYDGATCSDDQIFKANKR